MAVLDICEYQNLARDSQNNVIQSGVEPSLLTQLAIGGATTPMTNPTADTTRFVRLHSDIVCRVAFGPTPVAAATSLRLAAGATEFFGVIPGQKIAVITST